MAFRDDLPKKIEEAKLAVWQETLITTIFNAITNNYIFPSHENLKPEIFKKICRENILRINAEHPYANKEKFCEEMNKVLKKIDPHLKLQYDPKQIADHDKNERIIADPRTDKCRRFKLDGLDPPKDLFEKFEKENYGFEEKPKENNFSLPEAVGYIKINDFLDPRDKLGQLAVVKAHEILKNLQGKQGIIIDLRDSHGGSPEMVEYMISYLLSESDKNKIKNGVYNTIHDCLTNVRKEYKVKSTEFSLNVPTCVLTNENTFSAAEEFAYDLQQLNKHLFEGYHFIVMGQTTKGGAHPMTGFPLFDPVSDAIDPDYFLWVPTRSAINPYTKTNWEDGPKAEGKEPGVYPDIQLAENEDSLGAGIKWVVSILKNKKSSSTSRVADALRFDLQKTRSSIEEKKYLSLDADKNVTVEKVIYNDTTQSEFENNSNITKNLKS